MLGEKITATIRAKYYFGSPVTEATVKYKVLRTRAHGPLVSARAVGLALRPRLLVVRVRLRLVSRLARVGLPAAGAVVVLAPAGAAGNRRRARSADRPRWHASTVEIDTSRRQGRASRPGPSLRDSGRSRRPIAAHDRRQRRGARGPASRSRCSPGSIAATTASATRSTASFAARRLDGKPVEGTGKLRLLKITYGEAPERQADRNRSPLLGPGHRTPKAGPKCQIKASEKGQYRLSYRVTDEAGHDDRRRLPVHDHRRRLRRQRIPLQRPGNRARQARVRAGRKGSAADQHESRRLDGAACSCGRRTASYLPPQMLRLDGQEHGRRRSASRRRTCRTSSSRRSPIADGRVHTEVREIHVPPAKRILNVDVVPSADDYQPGQHATVKLKLTDEAGKPFVGSTVLSIFDKSVEYISGGSNVADIKEFFWKWRRQHQPYIGNEPRPLVRQSRCRPAKRRWRTSACSAAPWPMTIDLVSRKRNAAARIGAAAERRFSRR